MQVGGVGRNISEALVHLEVPTLLIAPVGPDPAALTIRQWCQANHMVHTYGLRAVKVSCDAFAGHRWPCRDQRRAHAGLLSAHARNGRTPLRYVHARVPIEPSLLRCHRLGHL